MTRRVREAKTIASMIGLYCKAKHAPANTQSLCASCSDLLNYAHIRLGCCRYGEQKPVCKDCLTHCYKPELASEAKKIMRYAGPRMFFYRPLLTLLHYVDGWSVARKSKLG